VRPLAEKTVETYLFWLHRFAKFVGKGASQWTGADIESFLWQLHRDQYAQKTRKQALCALVFVFKNVLSVDVGTLNLPAMAKEHPANKIMPSRAELVRIFSGLRGQARVMMGIMYGSGLRVNECCTLRVKDIDFDALTIRVHEGKGGKDRVCLLPMNLVEALQRQIAWRVALHDNDLSQGAGYVELPGRLAIKYKNAARDVRWQFLFPSAVLRGAYRWHTTPEMVQGSLRKAVKAAGILKRITPHTLRHAYCTHSLQAGMDTPTVQALMGHDDMATTQGYAHADAARGFSPLDVDDAAFTRAARPAAVGALMNSI
jgi:integron integrase